MKRYKGFIKCSSILSFYQKVSFWPLRRDKTNIEPSLLLEYLSEVCLNEPEIFCTCDSSQNVTQLPPATTSKPATTVKPEECSLQPIILYLLWIEDDFGLRNHKEAHRMGEFFGYFLETLHQELANSGKEYNIQVNFFPRKKFTPL